MKYRFNIGDRVVISRASPILDEPGLFGDDYSGLVGADGMITAIPMVSISGTHGWDGPAHDDVYLAEFTYVGGSKYEAAVPGTLLKPK